MTYRKKFFDHCIECGDDAQTHSGICPSCEVTHGYRDKLVDDVQPDQREPKDEQ